VYGYPKKGYNSKEIVHILLSPAFRGELLCKTHPVSVKLNVSFVVDLSQLEDRNDVRTEDLGAWKCTGSRILSFAVDLSGQERRTVSNLSTSNEAVHRVSIRRQYHVHATDRDLHQMVAFVESLDGMYVHVWYMYVFTHAHTHTHTHTM